MLASLVPPTEARDLSEWIQVCQSEDVAPGQMVPLDVEGLPPLAAFNVNGQIYVTSNVCTHNVAILTDGYFNDDVIECPLHGGCFNVRTGAATQFPCETPLQTYAVRIAGGAVYIKRPAQESGT